MQFNSIRSSAMLSTGAARQQEKVQVQSLKGDPSVLRSATSGFAEIPANAFRAVANAFGDRAREMLMLTADGR
jgi:hypothetical protein